jgi:hypothetical protein
MVQMNPVLKVEWKGFTSDEMRKLKKLWSRYQFPSEFCSRFAVRVCNGAADEPGHMLIQAKEMGAFLDHRNVDVAFSDLEDLAGLAADVSLEFSNRLWYCNQCGRPVGLGRSCESCPELNRHGIDRKPSAVRG